MTIMAIKASEAKHNIVGSRNFSRGEGQPQFVEINPHVPILDKRFSWRGWEYIVEPEIRWEPSIGMYCQTLIRIEGMTRFHVHRPYFGICYLCGCEITHYG